jgi:hypothetical protein
MEPILYIRQRLAVAAKESVNVGSKLHKLTTAKVEENTVMQVFEDFLSDGQTETTTSSSKRTKRN